MSKICSENVKNSVFWNTDTDDIFVFEKTISECREILIEIVDEYKDMLERLRDA